MGENAANDMADAFPNSTGRTPAEIERDLAISTLVDLRLLHAGPSASLFRAHQVATRRTVAVKVLHDELSSDVGQRFDRERAITGQLSGHTGIVPLFDTGTTADGEPYLVMPFYPRGSLADLMTRYGPLGWQEATFLMEPVAVTVAEVHGRNLVHRNIKPGNILLTDFLLPRVADFGMCLPSGQMSTAATLVETDRYSPPETANPAESNPTIDVFGLGATLWGLLSGHQPPTVEPRATLPIVSSNATKNVPGPPMESTPTAIAELVERSMSADPGDRPDNGAAFVTELRRAVGQAGASSGQRASNGDTSKLTSRLSRETPTDLPASSQPSTEGVAPTTGRAELDHDGEQVLGNSAAGDHSASDASEPSVVGFELQQLHRESTSRVKDGPSKTSSAVASADQVITSAKEPSTPATSSPPEKASSELYLLALVAVISTGILVMLAAAVLAVN